ncbi:MULTISPECIES: hypothetical protein [Cyanophyceae]|uniref:Uncharacterized protein n=1 Tax=Leptolyngbya subtilissima DQ-A4 TaxID=2933933 RepID=A0ABV0KE31_9CYAN|nr:hypothetical protein [Nodosilinea sp. FACHB-141]MBD2114934.1 hypothetical protein [Nodosilinea sp. FACHB-141]
MQAKTLCTRYYKHLDEQDEASEMHDFRNALFRYAVPGMGGPCPLANKRTKLSNQDVDAGLSFLANMKAEELNRIPEVLSPIFESNNTSQAQQERVRRNLRGLIDWGRQQGSLPIPENLIPLDLCSDIPVGPLSSQELTYSTRQIVEIYLQPLDEQIRKSALYAIVQYFVPGCGGPVPLHNPLRVDEIEAGLTYLEQVPLEYLQEALTIATRVLRIYERSEAQETRVRRLLRALLNSVREHGYLPFPEPEAKPEYPNSTEPPAPTGEMVYPRHAATTLEAFAEYTLTLDAKQASFFKSIIVRYIVPALGGPHISGQRATAEDFQLALDFLETVEMNNNQHLLQIFADYLASISITDRSKKTYISKVNSWLEWAIAEGFFGYIAKAEITLRTFRDRPVEKKASPSGLKLSQEQAPVHQLGAKRFPNDYTNDRLAQQILDYSNHRANKPGKKVTPGALKGEVEKIRQYMGWLHRYEGVSLEDLCFEALISVCQLKFRLRDFDNFEAFRFAEESGKQQAYDTADNDIKRIHRYLDFTGGKAASQQKRVSVAIAMAKFLYRDVLGTDEFPVPQNIPILLRLLNLQAQLKDESDRQPATVNYHEKSVHWSQVIYAMEMQRWRVEQDTIYIRSSAAKLGYTEKTRPERAMAQELQRFLSIAFSVIFPSRSRTFYELEIGKTFKEGYLYSNGFIPADELRANGKADEIRFYVHHGVDDYKTGSSMPTVLLNNDGFWVELPNLQFGNKDLYGYVRQWLDWGRSARGPVNHNYFFRMARSTRPVPGPKSWAERIKWMIEWWTGVDVPPANLRKMFTGQFPEYRESAALLLQHSEDRHKYDYDLRTSVEKMAPVVEANVDFINQTLMNISQQGNKDLPEPPLEDEAA